VQEGIQRMLSTAEQGRILREGVRTVICGEPNVGKSSLLNGLLGYERAIVSEIEGTTRDTVEEVINVKGIPVRLIDTAGVRESTDQIEQQGIVRSEKQIELADLILEVVDGSKPGERLLTEDQINGRHHLLVVNKTDLGQDDVWSASGGVEISCFDENGLDGLADAISDELLLSESTWGGHAMAINARHQDCLKKAGEFLANARESLVLNTGIEFASIDLREALNSIGEIAGRVDTEEILGEIFGSFCIGK
jgi:tRNA modification GTPase